MSSDLLAQATALANEFTKRLIQYPSTAGVVFLGALGHRQFFDDYSDIDIAVFVDEAPITYLPPFSFEVPIGTRTVELNVTQHVCPQTPAKCTDQWPEARRSAYRNGRIVFDRDGKLQKLISLNSMVTDSEYRSAAAVALNQIYWRGLRHARASWERGFHQSAHLLINDTADLAVQMIYCFNRVDRPHRKWQIHELTGMVVPPRFLELLNELVLIKDFSLIELERRISAVGEMSHLLRVMATTSFIDFPSDPYQFWAREISGRQLDPLNPVDQICDLIVNRIDSELYSHIRGVLSCRIICAPDMLTQLQHEIETSNDGDEDLAQRLLDVLTPENCPKSESCSHFIQRRLP